MLPSGWEGNRKSGVALATRHRHKWFSTYGLKALERETSTVYALLWSVVDFTLPYKGVALANEVTV